MAGAALNTVRYASGLVVRSPVNPVVRASERFAAPLGELPSGAAKLRIAAAGSGAAAAVGYGIGKVATFISGRKRNYSEMSSGYATDTQMGGPSGFAGATNVVQRSFVKGRSGRRMRRSTKNAHKLLQASMAYCNLRWQRMFTYGTQIPVIGVDRPYPASAISTNTPPTSATQEGRLFLSSFTDGTVSGSVSHFMPGYLFDLTTWRIEGSTGLPMRRIYFDGTGNVRYSVVSAQDNSSAFLDQPGWRTELVRGAGPTDQVQKSFLLWSDIRMSLYGARHCPTRFIVEMIQFKKDYFDPVISSVTSDQQSEINAHYVSEFKKLTFHPLDVQLNKRKSNIRVLSSRSFEVAPDSSTNEDPTAPNVLVKMFKHFNRLCNWQWAITNPGSSGAVGGVVQPNIGTLDEGPNPDVFWTEMDQPDWIFNGSGSIRPYLHPKARIYLYIRAEAMHTYDKSTAMNSDNALRHWPSFDICVRNRWMYEN